MEQAELKHNITHDLQDNSEITYKNPDGSTEKLTYGEMKSLFPERKEEPIRALVYWDDVCQYTSLALIDIINSVCSGNAKIDIEHFFNRPNEYIYGIDYVYEIYKKQLSKEKITELRNKLYWKILQMSLKSGIFSSIGKIGTFFNSIHFYFPAHFSNETSLKQGLKEIMFNGSNNTRIEFHHATDNVSFNDIMLNEHCNSIITPNVISTYDFIIEKGLTNIAIIAPENHNGMTEELYRLFMKMKGYPKPNYCSLSLYEEQIMYNE